MHAQHPERGASRPGHFSKGDRGSPKAHGPFFPTTPPKYLGGYPKPAIDLRKESSSTNLSAP